MSENLISHNIDDWSRALQSTYRMDTVSVKPNKKYEFSYDFTRGFSGMGLVFFDGDKGVTRNILIEGNDDGETLEIVTEQDELYFEIIIQGTVNFEEGLGDAYKLYLYEVDMTVEGNVLSKISNPDSNVDKRADKFGGSSSRIQNANTNVESYLKPPANEGTISKVDEPKTTVRSYVTSNYYAKPDLHLFDPADNRLVTLSNEAEDSVRFFDAFFKEELNKGSSFSFSVPVTNEGTRHVVVENKVAFKDKDGNFRLFVIKETEEQDGSSGTFIHCYCEPEIFELNESIIEDKRPQNRTAKEVLDIALENTRWQAGEVDSFGENSTNFFYESVAGAIDKIQSVWGGEFVDRIEISGTKITGRYIDLLYRRGHDRGKRWEIDKDIISMVRTTESYPKTALYGRGSSLETEGGGYTRKVDFSSVEWSIDNGDPTDKPAGQRWVGDPNALARFGRGMVGNRNLITHDHDSWRQGSYYPNGTFRSTDNIRTQSYFPIEGGRELTLTSYGDYTVYINFYSSSSTRFDGVGEQLSTSDNITFTTPEEAKFFDVYVTKPDISEVGNEVKVKLECGDQSTAWATSPMDVLDEKVYHRMGVYENNDIEDEEELLYATWEALQEESRQSYNFKLDVSLYAEKAGLDHETVRLGDTTRAINRRFHNPIEVEERIISFEYDLADPDDKGVVEFGQFNDLFSEDDGVISSLKKQIDEVQAGGDKPLDDEDWPDIKPGKPQGFEANGLFKTIQLNWDYMTSGYISAYELYASQIKGFDPAPDRLVWKGKSGGCNFEADTNETWFFKLRAVNTHGTGSEFTDEVEAETVRIDGDVDIEPLTITDQLIAHDAMIDFAKIGNVEITNAHITGKLKASQVEIGADTSFEDGYDPTDVPRENLILGSKNPYTFVLSGSNSNHTNTTIYEGLERNTTYTFSSKISVLNGSPSSVTIYPYLNENTTMERMHLPITNGRVEGTFTTDGKADYNLLVYNGVMGSTGGNRIRLSEYKLEKNSVATPWSPSPLDFDKELREDLRLDSPMPTSLSLGDHGIRATTSSSGRYAQMDHRGFFVKGGAIQIERPDGVLWMEDGLVIQDYMISGYDPIQQDSLRLNDGTYYNDVFSNSRKFFRSDYLGRVDGSNMPGEERMQDIRDPDKSYTWSFQTYEFIHSSKYIVFGLQAGNNNAWPTQARFEAWQGNTYLGRIVLNQSSGYSPLTINLGTPTYNRRRINLRIGFNRGDKKNNDDQIIFRLNRIYLTDVV